MTHILVNDNSPTRAALFPAMIPMGIDVQYIKSHAIAMNIISTYTRATLRERLLNILHLSLPTPRGMCTC